MELELTLDWRWVIGIIMLGGFLACIVTCMLASGFARASSAQRVQSFGAEHGMVVTKEVEAPSLADHHGRVQGFLPLFEVVPRAPTQSRRRQPHSAVVMAPAAFKPRRQAQTGRERVTQEGSCP